MENQAEFILSAEDVISEAKKILDAQCVITINNQTDYLLVHEAFYAAHGNISNDELPPIAPRYKYKDKDRREKTEEFSTTITVKCRTLDPTRPAIVMVWKFIDKDNNTNLWLLVFVWQAFWSWSDNGAYYRLYNQESAPDPQDFWKNCKENETYFIPGMLKEKCNQSGNSFEVKGKGNNENPMALTVSVEQKN